MGWDEIVGHEKAKLFLRLALQNDLVGHAYLFVGPRGTGKSLLALNFAKAANCERRPFPGFNSGPTVPDWPCDKCTACRSIDLRLHPDVIWVEPEGEHVRIDQVRYISRLVHFRPDRGTYRFVIVQQAEKCTPEAANAMLKILEEPPEGNVFILEASRQSSLPATVVSRCRILKVHPLPTRQVMDCLGSREDMHGIDHKMLSFAARLSGGSIGSSVCLIKDGELRRCVDHALDLVDCAGRYRNGLAQGRDDLNLVVRAWEIVGSAKEPELLVSCLLAVIRDLLLALSLGEDGVQRMIVLDSGTPEWARDLSESGRLSWETTFMALQRIGQALKKSINKELAMDALVMALMKGGSFPNTEGVKIGAGSSWGAI